MTTLAFASWTMRRILDEKEMTIEVVYNTKKTDLTKVKTAITKLGYDADDVKATTEGLESLDGCCKAK